MEMQVIQNLSKNDQSKYLKYLYEKYVKYWNQSDLGTAVIPVITKECIEAIFGIQLDVTRFDKYKGDPNSIYTLRCDVNGYFYNCQQLTAIASYYRFTDQKAYIDLLVAHHLFLYDFDKTNNVPLLADNMYNSLKLHKVFYGEVIAYCQKNITSYAIDDSWDISLADNTGCGICYKELMDYLHYDGEKPSVSFTLLKGNVTLKMHMTADDYNAEYGLSSYKFSIMRIIVNG